MKEQLNKDYLKEEFVSQLSRTILFVHGAWMTSKCWDKFIPFFERKGFQCIAPSWPYKEGTVEEQQHQPDEKLGSLTIQEIINHYINIIETLPEVPILIGHSFGGLFVQMLLDQGYGCAAVSIDSGPPKGVFAYYPATIRANLWVLRNPFKRKRVLRITPKRFNRSFIHLSDESAQKKINQEYVVPEGTNIFFEAAFSTFNNATRINFKNNKRGPLLLVAGSEDQIVPPRMNRQNYNKYKKSGAITDFIEFEGRTHWIIHQEGWEEVATYIDSWIEEKGK